MSLVIKINKVLQEIRNFYCHKYTAVVYRIKWIAKKCFTLLRVPTNHCCSLFLKIQTNVNIIIEFFGFTIQNNFWYSSPCSYSQSSSIKHFLFSSIYFQKECGKISVTIRKFFLHCGFITVIMSSFSESHKSVMDHSVSGSDITDCLQHPNFFFLLPLANQYAA